MEEPKNYLDAELLVDSIDRQHLKDSATWAKFLGVIGFAYSLLIVVLTIKKSLTMFQTSETGLSQAETTIGGVGLLVICLVAAGIIFLVGFYLFRFSKHLHHSLQENDQLAFSAALRNQRLYFRFTGIFTMILLLFTLLAIIGLMIGPQ